jgi:hypothetical protein
MEITRVKFKSATQQIIGVGAGRQWISVGDICDASWGGGNVTTLKYDAATQSLHIRKGARFQRLTDEERIHQPSFDVAIVPWSDVSCACGVDEEEPAPKAAAPRQPRAKPVLPGCAKCGKPSGGAPLCDDCTLKQMEEEDAAGK